MERICAVIPAHNEERTIGNLVCGLLSRIKNVVVIDDGSTDQTAQLAKQAGAIVLSQEQCQGKGAALRRGYNYCLANNFEAVLNLDADGQHSWQEVDKFLEMSEKNPAGIFIGNRMQEVKNMPRLRLLTNQVTSKIISFLIKQKVEDSQCGYRLIKREVLKKVKLSTSHFDTESELLIKAGRLGFKIKSIPIKTIYQREKSKINRLVDTGRFIRLIWKSFFGYSERIK